MGVTAFGKILRKRRIDSSEILGDMAKRLDVSAAYLSSIENGLREIPDSFVEKISKEYGLSEAEKQGAVDAMAKLTQNAQMEADAEMLLEAKGFEDVVVSVSDSCCDIVVGKEDVSDEKRAQIEDVIKRKTNINAENIVITTID